MNRFSKITSLSWLLMSVFLITGSSMANDNDVITIAREILKISGVKGGILVHLGCSDGKLTAALHADDNYTVHGLEADPAKVAQAR